MDQNKKLQNGDTQPKSTRLTYKKSHYKTEMQQSKTQRMISSDQNPQDKILKTLTQDQNIKNNGTKLKYKSQIFNGKTTKDLSHLLEKKSITTNNFINRVFLKIMDNK